MTGSEHGEQTLTTHDGAAPERPRFTIVTASFNALAGLRRTVDSVATQDFTDVEHVIVDGASSDGTREYLASLGTRVRWISEPDDGIADALNKGIAMASGDYILVLQAEDELIDGSALSRVSKLLGDDVEIVSFAVRKTGPANNAIYTTSGFDWASEFFMTVPHQGAFCRRSLYERIGVYDPAIRVAMDYDFMLRAKRANASIVVVNKPIAIMPDTGVSSRRDWPSLKARLAENRLLHRRHRKGFLNLAIGEAFWLVYPFYKRLRHLRIG